jgi:hypothetical protein
VFEGHLFFFLAVGYVKVFIVCSRIGDDEGVIGKSKFTPSERWTEKPTYAHLFRDSSQGMPTELRISYSFYCTFSQARSTLYFASTVNTNVRAINDHFSRTN